MQGREMHDRKEAQNSGYLRRRIGATAKLIDSYLTNTLLRGEIDEVLELSDGTMAPLDYKFAKWEDKLYDTYRTQLICYAWLIEENFGKAVNRGYLVYTRSKNYLLEVPIARADIEVVHLSATEIRSILQKNLYPAAKKVKKRCDHCTYKNVCTQ
jgi:CRISPR-associated exonuclease Cas4